MFGDEPIEFKSAQLNRFIARAEHDLERFQQVTGVKHVHFANDCPSCNYLRDMPVALALLKSFAVFAEEAKKYRDKVVSCHDCGNAEIFDAALRRCNFLLEPGTDKGDPL